MTPTEFRRRALAFPEALEGAHMGHADFRVGGRIFATLGSPDAGSAAVMLSPQDQHHLMHDYPRVFTPAAGKWGASGSTVIALRAAKTPEVSAALEAAWRRRAPKRTVAEFDTRAPDDMR